MKNRLQTIDDSLLRCTTATYRVGHSYLSMSKLLISRSIVMIYQLAFLNI